LVGAFITANCAYRKDALLHIGGFDEFFRNNGEDIDLFWRMLQRYGGRLVYDPSVIVRHSFPSSYSGLARKYVQYGIASSKLNRCRMTSPSIDCLIYRKLFGHLANLLRPGRSSGKTDLLYVIQLSSHIIGKVYGSLLARTVNL
jgi:GT2 family glycosyltransferase